jgi:FkbM family methyltransferase
MNSLFKRFLKHQREIRDLIKIMPLGDALKLALRKQGHDEIRIHLFPINRDVNIRFGTSDLNCLKKVFLSREYATPFDIRPKVIVDAGANIGMATLYFATQYPAAKIFAIEPEPSNFKILQQNCSGLANVILIEAALWPIEQMVSIANPQDEKFAFTVAPSTGESPSVDKVLTVTIQDLLKKITASRIDLLKLDIEGAELELFSNYPEAWLKKVQVIAMELHDRFRAGCSNAFYSAIVKHKFRQEVNGENIFVMFDHAE